MNLMKKLGAVALTMVPVLSFAVTDVTDITAAQGVALEYAAAVGSALIAIWGAKLAYRKFFGG